VQVAHLQEDAMFRTRCCGQRTLTRRCRSLYHWECWSTLSVRTQTDCIDCQEFHV